MGVREMMGSSIHVHLKALGHDVVAVVSGMDDTGHYMNNTYDGKEICLTFHGNVVHLFDPVTQNNLEWEKMANAENKPSNDGVFEEIQLKNE